jgi:hypothetical protein
VTSPAPAAELPWLESFAERLSFFKMNAATNFGMRISQIQAIVARTLRKLGLVSEGFEHRVARLLVNNLCECGPSSIEGKVYQVLHDRETVELTDLLEKTTFNPCSHEFNILYDSLRTALMVCRSAGLHADLKTCHSRFEVWRRADIFGVHP